MKPAKPKKSKVPANHPWRHTMVVPKDPSKQFHPLSVDGLQFKGGTTKKNRFQ